ncbi:hypothetical protein M8C13_31495 [Crossiella sp. SN42]|uniref:hypothetical protein n=1 Tax=Crossiella sp. SN42 TaxID=2944808 RepID=UPI00207D1670|nr:hypothetical protein [Crossiella sp. SN42]MCO1580291.1 hypothetical protein [Crossiella sp. SN42]
MPPGLSRRGRAQLARLERTRLWPEATVEALRAKRNFVRDPTHRLWDPQYGCGFQECCPDPAELRHVLNLVVAVLPPRDARLIRKRLAALDELW